ncbi:hypothetical protein BH23GEM10_BH23GEM10_01390 [soil metagenome]
MKRRYRIVISAFVAIASIGLVALLVLLGTAAEGPLGSALESVGNAVRSAESRLAQRLRGPGRAQTMSWLEPMRTDADALRRPERVLLGAYDDGLPGTLEGVLELEDSLGVPLPLIQVYTAWGDRVDQRFPRRIVDAISGIGSIPVITWEPWLTDFENTLHPGIPLRDQRDRGGLAGIAAGTYDFYIDAWAQDAIRFGRPVLVRFAHEMNDSYRYPWGPQNNRPEDFIAAWRRVVQRFRDAGAGNVLWVWAPHIAYDGYEAFYPGDDVVDWVATGTLNYGAVANWSQWWTFDEIFGQRYTRLAGFGKPIMIAEFGSLAVGGDRADWYARALTDLPERFPAVRALLLFNVGADQTVTYQALDWSILDDSATISAARAALRSWPDADAPPR